MTPKPSSSALPELEQWKRQIRLSLDLLQHGVTGFNRKVTSTDSSLLTEKDFQIVERDGYFDKGRPYFYRKGHNTAPLNTWSIKGVSISKFDFKKNKELEAVKELRLEPDTPMDFSLLSKRKKKSDDPMQGMDLFERLVRIEKYQEQCLLSVEGGKEKRAKAIEQAKAEVADFIATEKSIDTPHQLKLWGQPDLERFLFEKVIDIIQNPDAYACNQIFFPSSILLYGKPGCGKTNAVKRLAEFIAIPRFELDLSSVGSSYLHGTTKKITEIFEQAQKLAPAIVVMDEIDSILSESHKDDKYRGEEVAILLKWICEAAKHRILVVGMSNSPEVISDAAKRPGRFTHHFEVTPLKNKENIELLLRHAFDGINMNNNVSMDSMATHLSQKECTVADVYAFSEKVRTRASLMRRKISQEIIDEVISPKLVDSAVSNKA